MGNHRFRLSEMMPNAWIHKLKDMSSKTRNQTPKRKKNPPTSSSSSSLSSSTQSSSSSLSLSSSSNTTTASIPPKQVLSDQRKSYYFTRDLTVTPPPQNTQSPANPPNPSDTHFPESPRKSDFPIKSSKPGIRRRKRAASVSASEFHPKSSLSSDFGSQLPELDGFNLIPVIELPPIVTKQPEVEKRNSNFKEQRTSPVLRGVRLKTNSPRIGYRKSGRKTCRRSLSESLAVVKSSADPQRDFRESMVEMILENNIRQSKDLEDLLACYLQLNSDEYHGIIIRVFKQIWFDLAGVKLK